MKTLYLVRHAKSSWKDVSLHDRERPLNKRGRNNAPEMGRRLRQANARVERLITSPARRALNTAQMIAAQIDFPIEQIELNDRLYFTSFTAMLDLIRQTPDACNSLMLVGHNPDITALLHLLSRTDLAADIVNMPTCAIATLQFDAAWVDLAAGGARLVDFDFPKKG